MKFKISNKPFYQNHNSELERYQKFENTLHIVNKKSLQKLMTTKVT